MIITILKILRKRFKRWWNGRVDTILGSYKMERALCQRFSSKNRTITSKELIKKLMRLFRKLMKHCQR
jgi:hypothetical protein